MKFLDNKCVCMNSSWGIRDLRERKVAGILAANLIRINSPRSV
jgi:hypothetical protein